MGVLHPSAKIAKTSIPSISCACKWSEWVGWPGPAAKGMNSCRWAPPARGRYARRCPRKARANLIQRTDAGGNTKTYSSDQGGRLTQEEHKLGGTTLDQRISYQYDADGQMTAYEQKDGSGNLISSASYTKDALGRTTQSAIIYGKVEGGTFSFTLGQGFNTDGRLASHTYPDGSDLQLQPRSTRQANAVQSKRDHLWRLCLDAPHHHPDAGSHQNPALRCLAALHQHRGEKH